MLIERGRCPGRGTYTGRCDTKPKTSREALTYIPRLGRSTQLTTRLRVNQTMRLEPACLFESASKYFQISGFARVTETAHRIFHYQVFVLVFDIAIACILTRFCHGNRHTKGERKFFILCIQPGRWFLLHAVVNFFITIGTFSDFIETIKDPIHAVDQTKDYNLAPTMISMALHLYHCLAPWYAVSLSFDDVLHHFVFAVCGLGSLSLLWPWGPGSNFAFFFLTGFPGGIDYILLGMVKLHLLDKIKEKQYNASINTWIRGPGCVISAAWTWSCFMYEDGRVAPPLLAILLQNALLIVNGQYYTQRVLVSFTRASIAEAKKER